MLSGRSEQSLIRNKLLKKSLNFVQKYYFRAELLIVEYQ